MYQVLCSVYIFSLASNLISFPTSERSRLLWDDSQLNTNVVSLQPRGDTGIIIHIIWLNCPWLMWQHIMTLLSVSSHWCRLFVYVWQWLKLAFVLHYELPVEKKVPWNGAVSMRSRAGSWETLSICITLRHNQGAPADMHANALGILIICRFPLA